MSADETIEHEPIRLDGAALKGASVRQAVQRLRWFRRSFAAQVAQVTAASGATLTIHDDRLAEVFVAWLRKFEAQKPTDPAQRRAYVGFAAGLMLREMLRVDPLDVAAMPTKFDPKDPAHFWPEGHAYTTYCLNMRAAVIAEEYGETLEPSSWWHDIEAWWSFKENVTEDAPLAIPFLDLFSGETPNWAFPTLFHGTKAVEENGFATLPKSQNASPLSSPS